MTPNDSWHFAVSYYHIHDVSPDVYSYPLNSRGIFYFSTQSHLKNLAKCIKFKISRRDMPPSPYDRPYGNIGR